jgi:histidinol phosphatase-like enzyme
MLLAAGARMQLDLARSWIIGDRASDVGAGRAAHLAGGIILSPHDDEGKTATHLQTDTFIVDVRASLAEAVSHLLARGYLNPGSGRNDRSDLLADGSRS